ncbi:MAG: ribonuclease PH [Phycisphaerales bacterium]|nr:ribonuclease PH [Phycisphaerales bacterium]
MKNSGGKCRANGRRVNELRPLEIIRGYTRVAPGSVLIRMGETAVICSATVAEEVPDWMAGKGRGWVTAEYDMLPASTGRRRARNRRGVDGRGAEIQRLIGRVMRAVVDMDQLGERTIWLDCDVLQADGGTRTAAITGAYVALVDAVRWLQGRKIIRRSPVREPVAAVSVGKVDGRILLDLDYTEDVRAEVDFNVAMTAAGRYVEIQATSEGDPFDQAELEGMLRAARLGIGRLITEQKRALARRLPGGIRS